MGRARRLAYVRPVSPPAAKSTEPRDEQRSAFDRWMLVDSHPNVVKSEKAEVKCLRCCAGTRSFD